MSRRSNQLVLVAVILVAAFAVRSGGPEPQRIDAVPAPHTGVSCFRQGGDQNYCQCLDRLESARAIAGRAAAKLPPLDHPTIRYAMRNPHRYPIINSDTLRCLTPRAPGTPGVAA